MLFKVRIQNSKGPTIIKNYNKVLLPKLRSHCKPRYAHPRAQHVVISSCFGYCHFHCDASILISSSQIIVRYCPQRWVKMMRKKTRSICKVQGLKCAFYNAINFNRYWYTWSKIPTVLECNKYNVLTFGTLYIKVQT